MDAERYWTLVAQHHAQMARLLVHRYPTLAYMTCEDSASLASLAVFRVHTQVTEATFMHYFFQAARSQMRDALRWRRRQQVLERTYALSHRRTTPACAHATQVRQELQWYLAHLLPKAQRRLLAGLEEGSRHTATVTGRTAGAVRAGMWKARAKLKRIRQREETI
jgi:DNA-directed RNA polymerase specialized sigma24 family protein